MLPNSGSLPDNEATHPNVTYLMPNNGVWNREFAKPLLEKVSGEQSFCDCVQANE
jgi:hypothetical protein